jgi:hypothetical protein
VERRTFLTGSAAAAVGLSSRPAASQSPPIPGQPLAPTDLMATVARLRKQYLAEFDAAYVENVIVPFFLVSTYAGERMLLPTIDLKLTKENALPYDLWGLISESWKPSPENGVTVFLQALEKRGPENRRKRIYMSAVTPDLYRPMYSDKVAQFFDKLLDPRNEGKPLMRPYLEGYFDLYWDLRQRRCHPGAGPADWRELQHRSRLSRSDAEDRLRQLHDCAREPELLENLDQ